MIAEKTCEKGCSTSQISSWQAEIAIIIQIGAQECKDKTPHGFIFGNPKICLAIIVDIFLQINLCLNFLLGQCGLRKLILTIFAMNSTNDILVGGLLTLLLGIVATLIGALTIQLNFFVTCLSPCVPGLLGLVGGLLGGLLGGVTCFVCNTVHGLTL